jgi:hypothetical protein
MTACELLEVDSGFRTLIDLWVEHKEAPAPLIDYLLDRDMYTQASAAEWLQKNNKYLIHYADDGYEDEQWGWWVSSFSKVAHSVPDNTFKMIPTDWPHITLSHITSTKSPQHAFCLALDNYIGEVKW